MSPSIPVTCDSDGSMLCEVYGGEVASFILWRADGEGRVIWSLNFLDPGVTHPFYRLLEILSYGANPSLILVGSLEIKRKGHVEYSLSTISAFSFLCPLLSTHTFTWPLGQDLAVPPGWLYWLNSFAAR